MRISRHYIALLASALIAANGECQNPEIPGRDLLAFPVGLIAEAGALPNVFGGGFWNPASTRLPDGSRWRLSAAAISTPSDLSVNAHAGAVSGTWQGSTITASIVRASVPGLVRTESDPLTVSADLPYSTFVTSLGIARAYGSHLTWGVAGRVRTGQIELKKSAAVSVDAGFVADHLTRFDLRVGASTFLASPWSRGSELATYLAGADARLIQRDSVRSVRVGMSAASTQFGGSEQFAYLSARYGAWEGRAGPARTTAHGSVNIRARMAVTIHYAGYAIGVAREGTPNGLAPSYQFALSSLLR